MMLKFVIVYAPDGFDFFQKSRVFDRRGGGVAVILKQSLKAKATSSKNEYESFEHMIISIKIAEKDTDLAVIYRPPHLSNKLFLEDLEHLISENFMSQKGLLICGDFNVNFLDKTDCYAKRCSNLLDTFDLVQNVSTTTHQSGTCIDWIITRNDDIVLESAPFSSSLVSDHFAVLCEFTLRVPNDSMKAISFRKLKDIDLDCFKKDISELPMVQYPPNNLDILVQDYNKQLRDLLEKHAPLIT